MDNKNLDRPLILRVKDLENKLVNLINESKIPAFILKTSIEKIYNQLINIEQQENTQALESKNLKEKGKEKNEKK